MLVYELIEELQKLKQDDRVYWWNGNVGKEIDTVEENDDGAGTFVTLVNDEDLDGK